MDLIIDANILFAALIKESITIEIMLNENIRLFAPEFLLEEFYKHKEEILTKTKRTKEEFNDIYEVIKSLITFIPFEEFHQFLSEAERLIVDKDDVPYFALSMKLNIPIWSNYKQFQKQKIVSVYSTEQIIKLIKL